METRSALQRPAIPATPEEALFERLKNVRADGSEYWSARDLAQTMEYSAWRNFETPLNRAMITAQNQGHDLETHFAGSRKVVPRRQGGGIEQQDYELSRFAAYLVSMNGDPNKGAVAAAQIYFAVQTRVAETRPAPAELSRMEILKLAMAAEEENQTLRAQVEADAPKVGYYDSMVADNDYHLLRTVASDLKVGERDLRQALLYCRWVYVDSYRRRNSKGEIVTEYQWSEYAEKKQYFHRVMNHDVPLFKDTVSYTLKATTPGVAAITRLLARINAKHGSLKAALPALEAEYNARRAKGVAAPASSGDGGLW